MHVTYTFLARKHEFDVADSEDLSGMCAEVEERLRQDQPELAGEKFLTERVADALLNSLAAEDQETDLGELSRTS